MSLSPLDMSLFDAFKDSKDVEDLMQSGFLLFSEKYMSKCIVITLASIAVLKNFGCFTHES